MAAHADRLGRTAVAEAVGHDAVLVVRRRAVERHALVPVPIASTVASARDFQSCRVADELRSVVIQLLHGRATDRTLVVDGALEACYQVVRAHPILAVRRYLHLRMIDGLARP